MKARFFTQQEPVKIVSMDGKTYVFLCLNEEEKVETFPELANSEGTEQTSYEYDYAEIVEDDGVLDLNDVAENPEDYLDYVPLALNPDTLEKHRADIDFLAMEMGVEL